MSRTEQPIPYIEVLRGKHVLDRMVDEILSVYSLLHYLTKPKIEEIFESRGSEPTVVHRIDAIDFQWRVTLYHPEKSNGMEVDFIAGPALVAELKADGLLIKRTAYQIVPMMHDQLQVLLDGMEKIIPRLAEDLLGYQTLYCEHKFL
jgi:hypothetical protein